mgnify:CR=1 FL=1
MGFRYPIYEESLKENHTLKTRLSRNLSFNGWSQQALADFWVSLHRLWAPDCPAQHDWLTDRSDWSYSAAWQYSDQWKWRGSAYGRRGVCFLCWRGRQYWNQWHFYQWWNRVWDLPGWLWSYQAHRKHNKGLRTKGNQHRFPHTVLFNTYPM